MKNSSRITAIKIGEREQSAYTCDPGFDSIYIYIGTWDGNK